MSELKRDPERFLKELLDRIDLSPEERAEALQKIRRDIDLPVKLIGMGQTGVGKTELLRSIFRISDDDVKTLMQLRTGATSSTTRNFFRFSIRTSAGFRVEFTDGPGLGEDVELEEAMLAAWVAEIPSHDLLYWVLDASSRDIVHIQHNIKSVLDATGFRGRFLLVLNKVDKIELEEDERQQGRSPWNTKYNMPTKRLLEQIERRTADIVKKVVRHVQISPSDIVACSALKRWNHGAVLDRLLELLPPEKRLKLSENREVKSATELMDPEVRLRLQQGEAHQ